MAKILIMDDEPALRSIVYNMLKPLGHPLVTAEDGKQAIEVARREMPDLAMLDMRVPDMDGLEVLTELKKINPNIKGIMLSGFGDVETAVGALKRGAFDYLSKPFKIDEVLKVVHRALEGTAAPGTAAAPAAAAPTPTPAAAAPVQKPVSAPAATAAPAAASATAKKPMALFAVAGVALLAVIAAGAFLLKKDHREIPVPCTSPTALCVAGPDFWITDWTSGNIYQHARNGALTLKTVCKTSNPQPSGITFDGESLWTCSSADKRIYKHKIDATLTVTGIFELPEITPSGLYYDGINLWVIDNEKAKIYKHKLDDSLSILGVYDSPAASPSGMFKEGEFYYIGDFKTNKIYRVAAKDFTVDGVYSLPSLTGQQFKLTGIACDGKTVWISSDGVAKIYCYPLGSLKKEKY